MPISAKNIRKLGLTCGTCRYYDERNIRLDIGLGYTEPCIEGFCVWLPEDTTTKSKARACAHWEQDLPEDEEKEDEKQEKTSASIKDQKVNDVETDS